MSSENGKTVFEEAAAERELEELRRAIEESRGRRRRANEAFEEFLKGFGRAPRGAVPDIQPARLPERAPEREREPEPAPAPQRELERVQVPAARQAQPEQPEGRAEPAEPPNPQEPNGEGLFAFGPAPEAAAVAPVAPPQPATHSPLDAFAHEEASTASSQWRSIPAALTASRRSPARGIAPVVVIAVVVLLGAFLLLRGRSQEAPPPVAVTAPPPAAAPAPARPAATSGTETPPLAEISTIRQVWLRVTVDGKRVVEREVPEGTKIPLNAGSQIVIRAGDAGAVRVSIGGKDQGAFGPAGEPVTRTFTVKQ